MSAEDHSDDALSPQDLRELLTEARIDASPDQMRAILAFIEEAGGIEEAQELIEQLSKAA